MNRSFENYCLDCGWSASTDEYTRAELAEFAIEHACSTGHDVGGEPLNDERDGFDSGWFREQNGTETSERERLGEEEDHEKPRRVYRVSDRYRASTDGNSDSSDWRRTEASSGALTRGDFETELRHLVRHGYRAGVPIEGCDINSSGQEMPDYTIEIHELAGRPADD